MRSRAIVAAVRTRSSSASAAKSRTGVRSSDGREEDQGGGGHGSTLPDGPGADHPRVGVNLLAPGVARFTPEGESRLAARVLVSRRVGLWCTTGQIVMPRPPLNCRLVWPPSGRRLHSSNCATATACSGSSTLDGRAADRRALAVGGARAAVGRAGLALAHLDRVARRRLDRARRRALHERHVRQRGAGGRAAPAAPPGRDPRRRDAAALPRSRPRRGGLQAHRGGVAASPCRRSPPRSCAC